MRVATACTAALAAIATLPRLLAVEVGSCLESEAVDRKAETGVNTTADFRCDSYTRLSIRSEMVLNSTVGAVTFSNLALKIYGKLTVEPDVTFTEITNVDHDGGALKLELGAVGVFKGVANFTDISILPADTGIRRFVKGVAVQSKGRFPRESGGYDHEASSGGGGAVYHHANGTMYFMGKLTITDNEAYDRGEGGCMYNRGDVVVDGEAYFANGRASDGGAIFQGRYATFVFNGFATFQGNMARNLLGGAVANARGYMAFKAGSLFDRNYASSTGDGGLGGAIYNHDGGYISLEGPTAFINNSAYVAAGIYNHGQRDDSSGSGFEEGNGGEYKPATIIFPDDTIFEDNDADYCVDIYDGYGESCGLGEDTLANKETHLQLVNDSRLGAGDGGDDAAESAARAHHVRMEGGRTIDLRDMDHLHKMYS
eukprot:jgi/Undpi1/13212/HiC_scaffold_8.g02874.m1